MLSRCYLYQSKTNYSLELVGFGMTQDELEDTLEDIDQLGTNPFRYATAYNAIEDLVTDLPYRPEIVGVLDMPDRMLRYGHWGMDFTQL